MKSISEGSRPMKPALNSRLSVSVTVLGSVKASLSDRMQPSTARSRVGIRFRDFICSSELVSHRGAATDDDTEQAGNW